tara:strand:- start:537 stop:1274 length:738 start_codon:yes stop_codon:yes gene_type:complete
VIFNLFKSKPTLKDLIPKGFVDIHSHILPGIDDGVKSAKESIELILGMKKLGFSKIIGTPHTYPGLYNNTTTSIRNSFNKIKNIDFEIDYASEYMIDKSLIEKSENKKLLSIHKNFVLVETGFFNRNINFHDILFKIQTNGYQPILAHPERYCYLHDNFKEYIKLKKLGCLFQINLLSLSGYYGLKVNKICCNLIKNKLVDYIGSDFHSMKHVEFTKKSKTKSVNYKLTKMIEDLFENNKKLFNS